MYTGTLLSIIYESIFNARPDGDAYYGQIVGNSLTYICDACFLDGLDVHADDTMSFSYTITEYENEPPVTATYSDDAPGLEDNGVTVEINAILTDGNSKPVGFISTFNNTEDARADMMALAERICGIANDVLKSRRTIYKASWSPKSGEATYSGNFDTVEERDNFVRSIATVSKLPPHTWENTCYDFSLVQ